MKAIVIGAGASGLAATYRLKKNGIDVTTFEAKKNAGGRARGYFKDGYLIDVGAQFAAPFYTATMSVMNELGMGDEFEPFIFKTVIWRDGKLYPISSSVKLAEQIKNIPDMLRFRGLSPKTLFQITKMFPKLFVNYRRVNYQDWDFSRLMQIDNMSVADFALKYGGEDALEYMFQPLTAYMTLGEPEEVSMSHFTAILGFFIKGVYSLKHGMGQVCRTMHEACKDSVKLNTPVKKVVIEHGKVKGVETADGLIKADAVICSLTTVDALKLMPALPENIKKMLGTVRYSSTCHMIFGLEKRPVPDKWYSVVIPRKAGFVTTGPVESSGKSPHYAPPGGGLVHCLTYGRRAQDHMKTPDNELKKIMIDDLRRIIPDFPSNPPVAEIHRWDRAICLQPPGQFPAVQEFKDKHYFDVKGLYFAGTYLSMFSSVEAAVRSGNFAADMALKQ